MDHTQAKQLYIPENIKVGYQDRKGTYTGRLAYVVYYDHKKVLRKEGSWNSWRDHKIDPSDFTNVPTEGFVLNKGVGGTRESYGWDARNEYIRVYDPRGFEFEISVANLLFILQENSCSPGKGLEGQYVYAWDKKELVLLPANSQDFKSCKEFTTLQSQKVKVKELILGATYQTKNQNNLVYLGRFNYYEYSGGSYTVEYGNQSKIFLFWDVNESKFSILKNIQSIAVLVDENVHHEYAKLVDKYNQHNRSSPIVKVFLKTTHKDAVDGRRWYSYKYDEKNNAFIRYFAQEFYVDQLGRQVEYYPRHLPNNPSVSVLDHRRGGDNVKTIRKYLADQIVYTEDTNYGKKLIKKSLSQTYGRHGYESNIRYEEMIETPTDDQLFVELENGKSFELDSNQFGERL